MYGGLFVYVFVHFMCVSVPDCVPGALSCNQEVKTGTLPKLKQSGFGPNTEPIQGVDRSMPAKALDQILRE